MKVIVFSLIVVVMAISCYFADGGTSKKSAIKETSQETVIEVAEEAPKETIVQEAAAPQEAVKEVVAEPVVAEKVVEPVLEVVQDVVDEPAADVAQEAAQEEAPAEEIAQEEVAEPILEIAQEAAYEEAPAEEVAQETAEEPVLLDITQKDVQEEVPAQEIADQPALSIVQEEVPQEFNEDVASQDRSSEWNEAYSPPEASCCEEVCKPVCDEKRWYFEVKPGYYYLTDKLMREFFDNGGFTFRAETGYRFWKPFTVWLDGGYFQKKGHAIGGDYEVEFKLATITLGLKTIWNFNDYAAFYVGAGPRIFMMMMHNESPFVRGEDSSFGIGVGADGGFWIAPIPAWRNLFLDFFADYSWKKLKIEEDEISSTDFDVDVSGLTFGVGLGVRF